MAKKERKQKTGAPQPPLLEDLLGAGEAVLYGQVCWSIANRGTEPPKAGEVITLEGGYEEESPTSRTFRITDKSIENVERCLGLRTCGEAVALFAEQEEVEPWGECPQGHQEAAFDFMMHGIRPTEPCPECGEIPNFGNTMMSLDLHSDGPVRGVDGQEYTTCRGCGDDTLQLEGSSIVEWGWKIACSPPAGPLCSRLLPPPGSQSPKAAGPRLDYRFRTNLNTRVLDCPVGWA